MELKFRYLTRRIVKKISCSILIVIIFLILIGCAPKVMVPPKIDLTRYETIGLIEFSSNSEGNLEAYITQRFIEAMSEDQHGIKILELGKEDELLAELDQSRMGPEALAAIEKKYDIKTVITGILDLSEPSSKVDLWGSFTDITVSTEVSAMLTVKMRDTSSGATVWSASSRDEREVSDVGFFGGIVHFDSEDPDRAYGKLAEKLVRDVSEDFRVTWERK